MNLIPPTAQVTFEEFCLLIPDGQKADLIDGVIYVASPDNTAAADLNGWLYTVMRLFVRKRGLGRVYGHRVAFRLSDTQSPEPDIALLRKERLHLQRRGYIDGAPDLAVEIVSPDSIECDYRKKREQYRRARVQEYWIVDELEKRVTVLRLTPTGGYRQVQPRRGVIASQALPGFWLRIAWLWQDPLPDETEVLAEIMMP
jgi:Uma2 family endonuclease